MLSVGVIGLGITGAPIVRSLTKAGKDASAAIFAVLAQPTV